MKSCKICTNKTNEGFGMKHYGWVSICEECALQIFKDMSEHFHKIGQILISKDHDIGFRKGDKWHIINSEDPKF